MAELTLMKNAAEQQLAAEWQKATEYYLQALPLFRSLRNQRTEGITLNNLGVAYARSGNFAEAIRHWEIVLSLNPSNEAARTNLANFGATKN